MNKAFVREPEFDGRAFCPRCGTLGAPVEHGALDTHIREESRGKLGDSGWFCVFPRCDVAYFNLFDAVVMMDELKRPVYPHDLDAPICACFGLTLEHIERDVDEGSVARVKALLERANSDQARCATAAANGRSCVPEVQRCYMKLRGGQ